MLSARGVIFGLMLAVFVGVSPAARAFLTQEEERVLLARDCALTGQQVVALVEEQLDRPNPRGSLWVEARDPLIQSLTGARRNPKNCFELQEQADTLTPENRLVDLAEIS